MRPADRGEQVAQPIVEADLGVLVVRSRLARLRRELTRVLDELLVGANERTPATRRDDLVPVEREGGEDGLRACPGAVVGRTERLGCILDQYDVVAATDLRDRVVVAATAVEINRHHGTDASAGRFASRDRLVEQRWVEQPACVAVDEEGASAAVDDRIHTRRECER